MDLQKIDRVIEKINDTYQRKRMINITYLIKRILSDHDKSEADKIQLKLSDKTLEFFDDWYKTYQKTHSHTNNVIQNLYYILYYYSFMKKPIYNSSYKSKN